MRKKQTAILLIQESHINKSNEAHFHNRFGRYNWWFAHGDEGRRGVAEGVLRK